MNPDTAHHSMMSAELRGFLSEHGLESIGLSLATEQVDLSDLRKIASYSEEAFVDASESGHQRPAPCADPVTRTPAPTHSTLSFQTCVRPLSSSQ